MFNTISISDLQRSPRQSIKNTKGYTYILANNKKVALLVEEKMIHFLEERGTLQEYEDWVLTNSSRFDSEKKEGQKKLASGDFSDCVSFDDL